jgi:polyhydroxyalkanoate synthase
VAPTYVVSAVNDHIVPWESAYQTPQVLGGDDHRFVLSTGGHIAAIVNPPSPKSRYWTNESLPAEADEWLAGADQVNGTWWDDWAGWIAERAGAMVDPPRNLGSDDHPPIGDAPGVYAMRQPTAV